MREKVISFVAAGVLRWRRFVAAVRTEIERRERAAVRTFTKAEFDELVRQQIAAANAEAVGEQAALKNEQAALKKTIEENGRVLEELRERELQVTERAAAIEQERERDALLDAAPPTDTWH